MRFGGTPFVVLSPHHRAFSEYHRALVVGALGELIRCDQLAGHAVRAWRHGLDPPEVADALDTLYRGTHVIEIATRGVPRLDRVTAECGGWEFEAGALVSSTACVAAWWYRETAAGGDTGRAATDKEEWLVLGLRGKAGLWRVSDQAPEATRCGESISPARRVTTASYGSPTPTEATWR